MSLDKWVVLRACAGLASQQWTQKQTAARSAAALVELNADALSPEQAQQVASQLMQARTCSANLH